MSMSNAHSPASAPSIQPAPATDLERTDADLLAQDTAPQVPMDRLDEPHTEDTAPQGEVVEEFASPTEPNRIRRTLFVFAVTAFTLIGSVALSVLGPDTKVVHLVVDGLLSVTMITVITYIGAHSIDRSFGLEKITRMMRRGSRQ